MYLITIRHTDAIGFHSIARFPTICIRTNKEKIEYENNTSKYYSQKFNYDNKLGYLEISLRENNQYFIEIMYNYAKIEVMVDKELINKALINSISILRSITYDEAAINNMMSQNDLSYTEEEYELFDEIKNNSNIKDVYVGKIELKDGQPKITTNREQKAYVDSKTENIVTTERTYVDINEHQFIKQENSVCVFQPKHAPAQFKT